MNMDKPINVRIPDTIIGLGAINGIGNIAKTFKPNNILIVTDVGLVKAGIIDAVKKPLERSGLNFSIFDSCEEEPPPAVVEELAHIVKADKYDLLIGVGGGSSMDTTKAASVIALTDMSVYDYIKVPFHDKIEGTIVPKILVPTTSGTGSEWSIVTPIYEKENGGRANVVHAWENLPDKVIIDPELTLLLPQGITADTGMDALAHAIEAYTSCTANIISDMLASTAIKLISENIRKVYAKGSQNVDARYKMSIAAALAMNAVVTGGIGLAHFMNESLGPKARISHGKAVAMLLPAVMEYNLISGPQKFAQVAELMGENTNGLSLLDAAAKSVESVKRLLKDLELPQRLEDVGITEADIPEIARQTHDVSRPVIEELNPRDATIEDLSKILKALL
jgi:alcohol dehydrogenase